MTDTSASKPKDKSVMEMIADNLAALAKTDAMMIELVKSLTARIEFLERNAGVSR